MNKQDGQLKHDVTLRRIWVINVAEEKQKVLEILSVNL
jgi:hypothetical protein